MIKETLKIVFEDSEYKNRISKILDNLDSDQTLNLVRSGFTLDNVKNIQIVFTDFKGFGVLNSDFSSKGKLPICSLLERNLNVAYLELINLNKK